MPNRINQLRSGVVLSYINMFLGMLIPFFYTPVVLRMLGQAEYGLLSLSHSVVSYLSLLSFGFGTTIVRYISKYRAEEDRESLEKVYGFFILLYCALALIVAVCGVFLANNVEAIFHKGLSSDEQIKMRSLVLIMAASSALSFPLSVFSSMVVAHERFVFRNVLHVIMTVFSPAANLIALWLGYKSVGMAFAGLIVSFLFLPWNILYCRRKLGLKPRFARIPKALFFEMVRVSFYNFVASIVDMLFWATDKFILGMLAGSVAVAVYNIGATFNNMIVGLSTSISGVLAPKVTGMVVKKADRNELTELFVRVGRLQFLVIGLVVSGFIVFGKQFIFIWVGPDYADSYTIALLTIIPLSIPLIQNTGISILVAQNKQKFRSIVYFIIAVINVISTYLVVPKLGGIGAALCSCVSYLVGQGVVMNIYYDKVIGIDIPFFWRRILPMSAICLAMILCGFAALKYIQFGGWFGFFSGVILYTLVYSFLMYRFAMNEYEKDVVRKPIRRIKSKLHP